MLNPDIKFLWTYVEFWNVTNLLDTAKKSYLRSKDILAAGDNVDTSSVLYYIQASYEKSRHGYNLNLGRWLCIQEGLGGVLTKV